MYYQRFNRFLSIFALVLSASGTLSAQALFHKPVKVIGDPSFTGTASNPLMANSTGPNVVEGRELNFPLGVALDTSVSPPIVYIADAGNNRVLGYRYSTQMTPGAVADVILGQTDRFSNLSSSVNGRSTGMNQPSGLAVDAAGNLYVADTGNNRILRYPKPMAQMGAPTPDIVIGQTSLTARGTTGGVSATTLTLSLGTGSLTHAGLAFDSAGNLWVSDTGANRVLRYPVALLNAGTNGPAADLVLGQVDFASSTPQATQTSKTGLNHPLGLSFDPAGRLLVADSNSRVLVFAPPTTSNAVALRILGIDTKTTARPTQISLTGPYSVLGTPLGIVVPDSSNNRVLVFPSVDSFPAEATQFSPSATAVLGQTSYTVAKVNAGNAESSASSFNFPADVASSGTELFVVDVQNHRVLVFPVQPLGVAPAATRVIGQLDFPFNAVNLIEGKEFSFVTNNSGSAILDSGSNPPHLYVADTLNNRILGFANFTQLQSGNPKADLVIGQPDFNRAQINYPTNNATQPNAQGLNAPTSMSVDSAGNLYVADTGNSRILRFPAPFSSGKTALESADLVIGQSNFATIVTDANANTLNTPVGLALTADAANASVAASGYLIVSDAVHNRVLFYPKPFTNGMSATKVLGSFNFTNYSGGSSDPQRFSSPHGLAVDPQDRLLVADSGNHRVQVFNAAQTVNNFDTPPISLTNGLTLPYSISASAQGFWVADQTQNALLHFTTVDQLAVANYLSDATQPAISPRSAYIDPYGNLLATDGIDRVLYFTPEMKIISAANYLSRPQTAGAIVSLYPAITTGSIANGTSLAPGGATSIPKVLSDTQVTVAGTPAPLFYVSPSQINLVLPNSLPSGGSVDVIASRVSTGQIYGAEELAIASASPALFSSNQSGSGQVSATIANASDGSFGGINSPSNPIARGQILVLYGTGEGMVPNAPPDGQIDTGAVPTPTAPMVLIGSTFVPPGNVQYSGLAPTLVGVWQINVLIPATAQVGNTVPIKVFQNSVSSTDSGGGGSVSTTIAIK